ncbi:MAG: protein kinase [Deltaproteobacteria bacterium]|nr:protein kinase [Deltaproteobacteria bacterium]MDQ3295193.1 serine/threonine protein kinase [Myxococcota bacterium]
MPNPQPGTILGAYRVEGTIGSGSMGEVFRGIDTGLNRRVAIKILSEKHRDSPELRARFIREGRAVAAISHPNVVQVFATGTYDERPYIAMELLDGQDLGSSVEKTGPLDSLTAAHVVLDSAHGLAAAAKAGLIHRDVKPSNLVRLADGKVKVTDFGLAKPVDPGAEPALTAMGVVVGTPDYIAPEQARGEAIDERVDIYALGGTLYFLLTGVPPFRTGKPAEDKYLKVVARHLRNPAPDASVTNPSVNKELAELARLMMSKKASERPGYDDLIARITQILARLDPDAVPQLLASRERSRPIELPGFRQGRPMRPGSLDDSATVSEGDLDIPARRGVPGWLIAVTLVCLALFAAGLVVYLRRDTGTKPATGQAGSAAAPGDAAVATVDATPASVPSGMLLVRKADGTPWFFAAAKPLTFATYREMFAKHEQPGKPEDAVVNVSYTEAKSYVRTRGGRLLTSDEWDRAAVTPNFIVRDGVLEWVDSPDEKRKTVRAHGKTLTRPDARQKDVTFRMVKDL